MNLFEPQALGQPCEGQGCSTRIGPGLKLRFCAECRPLQPIPTRNSNKNDMYVQKYNEKAKARRQEQRLHEAIEYRSKYDKLY